jgi:ABC-type glycerol-3-phosphate transport system permease component
MIDSAPVSQSERATSPPKAAASTVTRQRTRVTRARAAELTAVYLILGIFLVVGIFPFLWMLRTAQTPQTDAFALNPTLIPERFTLDNLERVLTSPTIPFGRQFLNSVIVSGGTTLLVVIGGTWGAYALARFSFPGRNAFSLSLLLIQLFPGLLLIIPLFIVLTNLHLTDSLLGLILSYTTGQLPFAVWLLRGYFVALPREVEDAARVDGSGYFGVLFRIVLPTAAPGIAAAATLAFVNSWNEFLFAYVLINDASKRVLAVGLTAYIDQFAIDYSGLFAMASLTTIPVVLVFMVFQRFLVGGLAAGAVKS